VRILIAALVCLLILTFGLVVTFVLPLSQGTPVPGWASLWTAISFLLCAQILLVAFTVTFFILSSRNNMSFLPVRDYRFFVSSVTRLGGEHA
jgi:hypothetical protein